MKENLHQVANNIGVKWGFKFVLDNIKHTNGNGKV